MKQSIILPPEKVEILLNDWSYPIIKKSNILEITDNEIKRCLSDPRLDYINLSSTNQIIADLKTTKPKYLALKLAKTIQTSTEVINLAIDTSNIDQPYCMTEETLLKLRAAIFLNCKIDLQLSGNNFLINNLLNKPQKEPNQLALKTPLPPTLNEIINNARKNRYASAAAKTKWTNLIANECKLQLLTPLKKPVFVEFIWLTYNTKRDPDNIAAAAKFILDGIVEAGVIENDSLEIIQSPVIHWYLKSPKKTLDTAITLISEYPTYRGHKLT